MLHAVVLLLLQLNLCGGGHTAVTPRVSQFDYSWHNNKLCRVRAVANSPEFAEAFNCPAGTAMNPTNKCTIW